MGEWLEARTPAAPPVLAARVRDAIGDRWSLDASHTFAVCESAAEEMLRSLLDGHQTGRESALDLLVADALVTYAFEHAAHTGRDLDADAAGAMRRIAELGGRYAVPAVAG